jgi:hypothetical protein
VNRTAPDKRPQIALRRLMRIATITDCSANISSLRMGLHREAASLGHETRTLLD